MIATSRNLLAPPSPRPRSPRAPGVLAALALAASAVGGCDGAPDTGEPAGTNGADDPPGLELLSVEVRPTTATVVTGPDGGTPTPFEAWGTLSDGTIALLDAAEWSISNSTTGSVDEDGVFTPTTENGGVTWVTAEFAGVSGNATVTVSYQDELVLGGADPNAFSGASVDQPGWWLYPSDQVNFPRNTPGIAFQWLDPGASAARLRFRSTVTDLTVYTTGTSWTADVDTWQLIAGTNAGGSVEATLELAVGGEVWRDTPLTLNVNRMDGEGTIYYWSTSQRGIVEVPYGGEPSEFLTPDTVGSNCIGCHAVAAGKIAFTYTGVNGQIGIKRLADGSDIIGIGEGAMANFKTFSPDGRYLLVSRAGSLILYDAESGEELNEVPAGGNATQPDWAADGSAVVYVRTGYHTSDFSFTGGEIMVMDYLGDGRFGEPRSIYAPPAPYNAYYPVWSPDSRWIAFNISTEDSYDDVTAQLYVMDDIGGEPVLLANANFGEGLTNSMPKWGPLPDDEVLWLAFSSKRPYGMYADGNPQIWVAGFDPTRAAQGLDPTWPAFWLPGQDRVESNHVPFWADL